MPRPMKFWELISAFRERKDILEKVLSSPKWQAVYWENYQDIEGRRERQNRKILDAPVPFELSHEIAAQFHTHVFQFIPEKGVVKKAVSALISTDGLVEMTALEVHDRFGGSVIEEVLEFGSAKVEV